GTNGIVLTVAGDRNGPRVPGPGILSRDKRLRQRETFEPGHTGVAHVAAKPNGGLLLCLLLSLPRLSAIVECFLGLLFRSRVGHATCQPQGNQEKASQSRLNGSSRLQCTGESSNWWALPAIPRCSAGWRR